MTLTVGCQASTMAGLISPKPVYHPQGNGQYSSYARGLSVFSETPPLSSSSTAPQSQISLGAFTNAGISHPLTLQADTKIYSLVVELMDPATREAALLELSKKREQYDDLALVLWHSFGRHTQSHPLYSTRPAECEFRDHARSATGNCFCISSAFSTQSHSPCVEPSLQRFGLASVRCVALRYPATLP